MPQSRNTEEDPTATRAAHDVFRQLLNSGRSFSGNEPNCAFLNLGSSPQAEGRFATVSAVSGIDFPEDGRGLALVDWDHDGDLDMWISNRTAPRLRLMRNDTPQDNHFVSLLLEGDGVSTNRDAIGARVRLEFADAAGSESISKTLRAGEGFISQSSRWLHFGLGEAESLDQVVVEWPGGQSETFTGVELDGRWRLVEGQGVAQPVADRQQPVILAASTPELPANVDRYRVPLIDLLPASRELPYFEWDGSPRNLATSQGKPILVNLWASYCTSCLHELGEIAQREEDIREAGLEIVALSIDGVRGDAEEVNKAHSIIERLGFDFQSGLVSTETLSLLQLWHNTLLTSQRPLPVPASFLLDEDGRIAVIYKGPVSVDQLLADLEHSRQTRDERQQAAAMLPGSAIDHPLLGEARADAELALRYQRFGEAYYSLGNWEEGEEFYLSSIDLDPDTFTSHYNLAVLYLKQSFWPAAATHFKEAARLNPDHADSFFGLGRALDQLRRPSEAVAAYEEAIRLEPHKAQYYAGLGDAYAREKSLDEAIASYQQAIELDPNYSEPHFNLALIYQSQGRLDEAIQYYEKALELSPDLIEAHHNVATLLARQGEFQRAAEHFVVVTRLRPDLAPAYVGLARCLASLGNFEQAATAFERALQNDPQQEPVRQQLVLIYQQLGRSDQAIPHARQLLDQRPDSVPAQHLLAELLATQPYPTSEDAQHALGLATQAAQSTNYSDPAILDTLAAAQAANGQFPQACATVRQAIDLAAAMGDTRMVEECRRRLQLYEQGRPYRVGAGS